ncbi:MAG: hydrogenase iron-sulfur subunit, partial [Candidatus Thermoplasmatota archaeon]|nr:hydrogenase iron-sulfur subunit [Candidatus Thermoplasmatota archaeon]
VACGICAEKCPVKLPSEYDASTSERKAVYRAYPQSVPSTYVIDKDNCIYFKTGKCRACEKFCEAKAIDFDQSEEEVRIDIASVIIASGADVFDPSVIHEYGYGVYPNVITSLEFERLLSASGPTQGEIVRPSDGKEPENIAFIQCVGSRSVSRGGEYCSSVCCMYALKQAIVAKEHAESINVHIFAMDLRAYGREFEDYRLRAEEEYEIQITRNNRVASLEETLEGDNIIIAYLEEGEIMEETYDLVVLSVGLQPRANLPELCKALNINLDEYGFLRTKRFEPVQSSRPGVYVAGVANAPMDIPDSVCQASAVADLSLLATGGERDVALVKELPEEIDVSGKESRVGVFVCHCGINIGGVVDVPSVVEHVRTLPNVAYAEDNLYTCSVTTQDKIKEAIKEHDLNRIVVASCSPRSYEKLFQETIREAGLNPYLFEMANIREHCSWVHSKEPERATEKAKGLVAAAVAKARLLEPIQRTSTPVTNRALVIGGGLSGMAAALSLAEHGIETHLVEKSSELGGNLRRVTHTLVGEDPQELLKDMIGEVRSKEGITLHMESEVQSVSGFVGDFRTELSNGKEIDHGVVILATGAVEYEPTEYLYGKNDHVITQLELEEMMLQEDFNPGSIVIIQCVGSRVPEYHNCSRICCSTSIKNALWVKERYPETPVYVLYKDIRTYGFRERFYREASKRGIIFLRYNDDNPPDVREENGKLKVVVKDRFLGEEIMLRPEHVVLNAATRPSPDNERLSEILKVPLGGDGFFLEAHRKLRPVEFSTEGIFLCGLAQGPKFVDENLAQAHAAAAKVVALLSKEHLAAEGSVAFVDEDICVSCRTCESICPFDAIHVDEDGGKALVTDALCKGCGSCASGCPARATTVKHFTEDQILAQVAAIASAGSHADEGFNPRIVGFLCNWCSYAAADLAGVSRFQYSPNVSIIRVMCSARVDPPIILAALLHGADGVFVAGCHLGDCHYTKGNYYAERRMKLARRLIEKAGIDPRRFMLEWISASEGARFASTMSDFTSLIRGMGPNPVAGEDPDEDRMRLLAVAKEVAEDFRPRALINKQIEAIDLGNVYGKKLTEDELDGLLNQAMDDEFDRYLILRIARKEPLSVKRIAELTGMPSDRVLNQIAIMRKRHLMKLDRIEAASPLYVAQES